MNSSLNIEMAGQHSHDLRRKGASSFLKKQRADTEPAETGGAGIERDVVIRLARREDASALLRLSQLEGRDPLTGTILVAEQGGKVTAAISLADRARLADPFSHSGSDVELLELRVAQLRGEGRPGGLRRRLGALTRRGERRRHSGASSPVVAGSEQMLIR